MENRNKIIDECVEIVKKHITENCDDHTPYRGACVSCGQHSNPELIKEPYDLLEELEELKKKFENE